MPTGLTAGNLRGPWAALIVPWTADDELDERRFEKEVRSYGGTGVGGVYTGGSTGEFYAQDDDTFGRISRIACEHAHAVGLRVQIGCTALSTRTARGRVRTAIEAGADGIQIAIPFWMTLSEDESMSFIRDVAAEAGKVPLILYHTMRAKRELTAESIGRLAQQVPTFIGMKDTGCDIPRLKAMLQAAPHLAIFGGEHDMLEKIGAGGTGTYSSVTGLNARRVVELYDLCAAGRFDEARALQKAVSRLIFEALLPMVKDEGLLDSAVDRVQRIVGGGDVGLACQKPYRSATPQHVERLRTWLREQAPILLP